MKMLNSIIFYRHNRPVYSSSRIDQNVSCLEGNPICINAVLGLFAAHDAIALIGDAVHIVIAIERYGLQNVLV